MDNSQKVEGKLRLKMWHKRGVNISEHPFLITIGISQGLTHFITWKQRIALVNKNTLSNDFDM